MRADASGGITTIDDGSTGADAAERAQVRRARVLDGEVHDSLVTVPELLIQARGVLHFKI